MLPYELLNTVHVIISGVLLNESDKITWFLDQTSPLGEFQISLKDLKKKEAQIGSSHTFLHCTFVVLEERLHACK